MRTQQGPLPKKYVFVVEGSCFLASLGRRRCLHDGGNVPQAADVLWGFLLRGFSIWGSTSRPIVPHLQAKPQLERSCRILRSLDGFPWSDIEHLLDQVTCVPVIPQKPHACAAACNAACSTSEQQCN